MVNSGVNHDHHMVPREITLRGHFLFNLEIDWFLEKAKLTLEHLQKLLIKAKNLKVRGALFNLIFDQLPTYTDFEIETPKLSLVFKGFKTSATSEPEMVRRAGFEPA